MEHSISQAGDAIVEPNNPYDMPGKFEVSVGTFNSVNIDVEADSADDAEKIVKGWVKNNDDRFYLHFRGPTDRDTFNPGKVDANPA